jgi:transketolase
MQRSARRVYCLISDAECNEGSVWEAAMFAAHHRLGHLTAILDWNGQQALGRTADVLACANQRQRWEAFGWRTVTVDGHSVAALAAALAAPAPAETAEPLIVLARTVFGKGVSYMEQGRPLSQPHLPVNPVNWHYLPMSAHEYDVAMTELERSA